MGLVFHHPIETVSFYILFSTNVFLMHAQLLTISLNFKDQNSIKCVIFSVNVKHKSGHLTGTKEVT